jgi:hypothetical protein
MSEGLKRIKNCLDYLQVVPGVNRLHVVDLKRRLEALGPGGKESYGQAIHLPGEPNTKGWRNALRSLLLINAVYFSQKSQIQKVVSRIIAQKTASSEQDLQAEIVRVLNRAHRLENRTVMELLAKAATTVLDKYKDAMDLSYIAAVRRVFLEQGVNSDQPLYCFWHHKTPADWATRLGFLTHGAADPTKIEGSTQGFCGAERSLADFVPLPPEDVVPLNRTIEVPDLSFGNIVHEMLHWVTHDAYEKYTYQHYTGNDKTYLREGPTEWLKRNAMGVWDAGGYTDVFPVLDHAVKAGFVAVGDLTAAYLQGDNVAAVTKKLMDGHKDWHEEQARKKNEAVKARFIEDTVARNTPQNAGKAAQKVFAAYKDAPDAKLNALPNGWGNWIRQTKKFLQDTVAGNPPEQTPKAAQNKVYDAYRDAPDATLNALPNGWGNFIRQTRTQGGGKGVSG